MQGAICICRFAHSCSELAECSIESELRHSCAVVWQELDMSRTRMGPAACVVLSGALKDNSMMERLMLHDNPLGEVGAWHLMAAITANKNLEYIGLQGSNFISTGMFPPWVHA